MIVLDGLSNPMLFGWNLFLFFEILTVFIEGAVLAIYVKISKIEMDVGDIVMAVVVMNLASMLVAVPFWESLGGF
jgi:hypothetical protein